MLGKFSTTEPHPQPKCKTLKSGSFSFSKPWFMEHTHKEAPNFLCF